MLAGITQLLRFKVGSLATSYMDGKVRDSKRSKA